jgi:hypothetical protein
MRSVLLLALVACGPSTNAPTDGPGPDAPPADAPASVCDYFEQFDFTNDDIPPANGTPEDTGETFDEKLVVCGRFDATHFDGDITVDVDTYLFTVAADVDVLVRLHGAGAETIELVGLDIYQGANFDQLVTSNTFYGDHGVTAVRLAAGIYELAPFALASNAIPDPIDYQITITADQPDTRCAALTSGGFAEAGDGGNNTGNDMVAIPSGSPPSLTAGNDTPETSGITLESSTIERVTGEAANVAQADQYEDKDTFLFTTGSANELAVRLDWPTAGADLDYLLFEANSAEPVIRAIDASTTGPELRTFSVKPSTDYWLLIGATTGTTVPATYSATLCGGLFAP